MKDKFNFLDTGIVLATTSAIVYFFHYMYLFGYYEQCGVALVDLHYSLQDILFCNPWVVLFIVTVAMAFAFSWMGKNPEDMIVISKMNHTQKRWGCYFLLFLFTLFSCCFYWLGGNQARQHLKNPAFAVRVDYDGNEIDGYSYLTRNEDSYYLFKTKGSINPPELLILRADKVTEMVTGKTLP